MPSHGKGTIRGDGEPVTGQDREANEAADTHAKAAAEAHRIDPDRVEQWKVLKGHATEMAMWLARVTEEANNHSLFPHRDSTASKVKADAVRRRRKAAQQLSKVALNQTRGMKSKSKQQTVVERSPMLGGHRLHQTRAGPRSGWRCELCKQGAATWSKIAGERCPKSMAERWAKSTAARTSKHEMIGPGHELVLGGDVMWCLTCGRYADTKAVGLTEQCKGVPGWSGSYGRAWGNFASRGRAYTLALGKHSSPQST